MLWSLVCTARGGSENCGLVADVGLVGDVSIVDDVSKLFATIYFGLWREVQNGADSVGTHLIGGFAWRVCHLA